MKHHLTILAACIMLASCHRTAQPVKIIFETDMGNDVDDAVALAMLHRYVDDGAAELLAVGINKEGACAAEFVDLMDTWYGHPDIPIGIVHDGLPCGAPKEFTRTVAEMDSDDGTPLFRRTLSCHDSLPDAVTMYRRVLSAQEDGSVTIASVGFSTNLARLLQTGADEYSPLSGPELVKAKVKQLVMMAGDFTPDGRPEYNVRIDIPSARAIFESWPGTVVTSPFELGNVVRYPGVIIQDGFSKAPHPLVEAYKAYKPMPYDRQMWDPTAVMFAVEGAAGFTISEPGRISVDDSGATHFEPAAGGDRFYLSVQGAQAEQMVKRIVGLTADNIEDN